MGDLMAEILCALKDWAVKSQMGSLGGGGIFSVQLCPRLTDINRYITIMNFLNKIFIVCFDG